MTKFGKALRTTETPIPGLLVMEVPVHGDSRGWFKENWQRERMMAEGLPDFRPVQNNVSFNDAAGTTRGIHAEPWDKFVSVATGRIFGAWIDLRAGPSFGVTYATEMDPSRAVFVPRGVGNAFQTLEPNTVYTYLVNDHYSPDAAYTSVNVADPLTGITWPIPLDRAQLSAKDRAHPALAKVQPIGPRKTIVLGATGQLGRALQQTFAHLAHVEFTSHSEFDLASSSCETTRPWRDYDTIINAAAYTSVDLSETPEGRTTAWATNVAGVARLARLATTYDITLVQVSSDYVFDGASPRPYREGDPLNPLGVYGQTKAAGEHIAATVPKHYIVRTSWVIGEGRNFVRSMLRLAENGANPHVVGDQYGRLTFALDIAQGIRHLLDNRAPYGTYNLTGTGPRTTWGDIAQAVFNLAGYDSGRVQKVTTEQYRQSTDSYIAPRPRNSVLDLTKITAVGFQPSRTEESLETFVKNEINNNAYG